MKPWTNNATCEPEISYPGPTPDELHISHIRRARWSRVICEQSPPGDGPDDGSKWKWLRLNPIFLKIYMSLPAMAVRKVKIYITSKNKYKVKKK